MTTTPHATDEGKRIGPKALELLDRALEMEHRGGFYTADRREYLRCEKLRERGLLKLWNGRRSTFWSAQFFDITDKGRIARIKEHTR